MELRMSWKTKKMPKTKKMRNEYGTLLKVTFFSNKAANLGKVISLKTEKIFLKNKTEESIYDEDHIP